MVSGRVAYRAADHVLIDTGGVGYEVYCSERTMAALPEDGAPAALFTELVVREDLMQLYGFLTRAEREWHRLLVSVQGVGAKAALAILGALGEDGVSRALSLGDAAAIQKAPGVGPKIAQRVINELQAKAPNVMALGVEGARRATGTAPDPGATVIDAPSSPSEPASGAGAGAQADALSALVNLGYGRGEAAAAVAESSGADAHADASALIRAALRLLAPGGSSNE